MDIKEQIRKSGLKQKFIADKIGVSKEHLNRMLNDKNSEMPDKYRIEIASLLQKVS